MTYGRVLVVGLTVGLLCLVAAPASSGHSTDQLGRGLSERELRQFETRMLGSAHVAEHALSRRLERRARVRWRKLSPAQRRAERARDERARRRLVARSAAAFAPETDGRWNGQVQHSGDGHPRGAAADGQGAVVGAPGCRLLGQHVDRVSLGSHQAGG